MTKLNQIIAVQKGAKSTAESTLTKVHHDLGKTAILGGIARTYRPKDDEGEQLPSESTRVQLKANEAIASVTEALTRYFDVEATKEAANTQAKANVVVDGKTILADVPATTLLFLEKQLVNLRTFIDKLPTLDPSEEWKYDPTQDVYATPPVQTIKTKKVMRNHVKAEATDKHPAQVETYSEDVMQGTWSTVKFSGALPAARVNLLRERVEALQVAVKYAREEANSIEVKDQHIGKSVFGFLFA